MTQETILRVVAVLRNEADPKTVTLEELQSFEALIEQTLVAAKNTL